MARDEASIDIWVGSNLGILKGKIRLLVATCREPCEDINHSSV